MNATTNRDQYSERLADGACWAQTGTKFKTIGQLPCNRLTRWAPLAGLCLLLAVSPLANSATITYNFNNGLQGWQQIGTTSRNPWNSGGNAWGASQAGSVYGYDADDGGDNTYWVRSPEFRLDGSGPLSVRLWGGKPNSAAPASELDVPAASIASGGFKGVALREVSSGTFVKSLGQPDNGNNGVYTLSAADLAPYANNGKNYTLDYLDYDHGGWGWIGLDDVSIPGVPMALVMTGSAAINTAATASLTVTIPSGFNASGPVTVYLTNSDPSKITINGGSAQVTPLVFSAGAPNTQTFSVTGLAPGYPSVSAGSPGLQSSSLSIAVLKPVPASGLIGRWITGAQDLADKSGHMPAGTHDGVVPSPLTATFSTDLPPGVSAGASLDVAGTGSGVMIANTVITDAGYQPTFDNGTANQLSVAFWAKGLPGGWSPFISKWGEDSSGWQVRRRGDQPVGTFTLRGTPGDDDPFDGSTILDADNWHHYVATWDGIAGTRKLYIDGKLNNSVPHDIGPMGLANVNYLTIGGRSGAGSATPGNTFGGFLYDVQLYGIALNGSAVQRLFSGNSDAVIVHADSPVADVTKAGSLSISIPPAANASSAVTVYVTNTTPAVISLAGAVNNVVALSFAAGGPTSQSLSFTGIAEGQGQVAGGASGLLSGTASVQVYGPKLIGRWFNGTETLNDVSGFSPAGRHDGVEVGTPGTLSFATDVPPSKPGKAPKFQGAVGVMVNNTSLLDANYAPTFDDLMARQGSIAFWAKGLPGGWSPFVAKRGEESIGWQVRRFSSDMNPTFTVRGTPGSDDPRGATDISDGAWHHFAAVWDGYAGTRKLYVDGKVDPNIDLTADFGPMMMSPNHHLVLGAREQGGVSATPGYESFFNGLLYEVRIYNYPLSEPEIKTLSFVAAIKVIASQRSLEAPNSMPVDIILPEGATQNQAVSVQVVNAAPSIASLNGASGNTVTLTFPVGGSLTQSVTVVGIKDGRGKLSATGGGFAAGEGTFNVWADPGSKLIARWVSGAATLAESSGFRPTGTHDGVAVGGNAAAIAFSTDVPSAAPAGSQSLDLSAGDAAVMVNNSAVIDAGYVETFDNQIARKFSITFWAKGTPTTGDWNPWISKRGESGAGYQVRRFGGDNPVRPTFTLRGTPGDDDPWIGTQVDGDTWHHYAATWDGNTGIRKLYLDGAPVLGLSGDFGPMGIAPADHFMIGGRDNGGFQAFFQGLLYDVRVYSYALDPLEVGAIAKPPSALSLTLAPTTIPQGSSVRLAVTVPMSAVATGPVTVYLTNNSPGVINIVGSPAIVFPAGSAAQTVILDAIGLGQIKLSAGALGIGSVELASVNVVVAPKLIGHWINGEPTLADKSGYASTGTHDGTGVGADMVAFSSDVPVGFSGQSLDLTANATGTVGVIINNSALTDTGYLPTYDEGISSAMSVAFWAKGFPNSWSGFVSKRGEDGVGWQVRRHGDSNNETFTIRGTDSGNDDPRGSVLINDGGWHHFAAVWDGLSGTRKCYVDGVLDPSINLIDDYGPMNLAPNHHVCLGTREVSGTGNYEAWFNGKLYDVRIYNYPISPSQVSSLAGLRPSLVMAPSANGQVRVSWPASATGYVLETSGSVTGSWGPSGLTVIVEGTENAVYLPTTDNAQFLRLRKQ